MPKGTGLLRKQNNSKVLKYLIEYQSATKKEVADYLNLSVMTVNTIFNDYLQQNIIIEENRQSANKGRPTQRFHLSPDYYHLLLIILRKYKDHVVVIYRNKDASGYILHEETLAFDTFDFNIFLDKTEQFFMKDRNIKAVALSIPGIVSKDRIIESDIIELKECPVKEEIEKRGIPCFIYNDMNCSVYGYYLKENKDLCFITFPEDTGPGCGTIIDGKVLEGKDSIAGEILYLPFFNFLKTRSFDYEFKNLAQAVVCIATILNPSLVVLTGDRIKEEMMKDFKKECLEYLPERFVPEIIYVSNYDEYNMNGLEQFLKNHILGILTY